MPRQKLFPEQNLAALSIRLPEELYQTIQKRSQENRRSLNQEVIWLLQKAIELLDEAPKKSGQ